MDVKKMKKLLFIFLILISAISLSSCDMINDFIGGDTDTIHKSSYEPITGKYNLYEAADKRYTYTDTYFEIDGSKSNFSLKYYENGKLKREGAIQRLVTYTDSIGKWCNNLHFNVKVGNESEHISTYTESFDPINQFRIIEEYDQKENKYYLSEMPYVMGTYVREGASYKEEAPNTNERNLIIPTLENFTSALNGFYKLDDSHYFYFVSPRAWAANGGTFLDSYFVYYSNEIEKPIEGFAKGFTFEGESTIYFKTLKLSVDWGKGSEGRLVFGYSTFDENDNMYDHFGTVDFSDGVLKSFTFEHLSRQWTDEEWDLFTKDKSYHMPDPIIYEYKGGTYTKA